MFGIVEWREAEKMMRKDVRVCVRERERERERERVYMCVVEQVDVFVGKSVCGCSRMGR